jgi:hypothetical protein
VILILAGVVDSNHKEEVNFVAALWDGYATLDYKDIYWIISFNM